MCSILAFSLLPFTPTDCHEALITMVQVMLELASVIEVGIAKECKLHMYLHRQDRHDFRSLYVVSSQSSVCADVLADKLLM